MRVVIYIIIIVIQLTRGYDQTLLHSYSLMPYRLSVQCYVTIHFNIFLFLFVRTYVC